MAATEVQALPRPRFTAGVFEARHAGPVRQSDHMVIGNRELPGFLSGVVELVRRADDFAYGDFGVERDADCFDVFVEKDNHRAKKFS